MAATIYKVDRADGTTEYTDAPKGAGKVSQLTADGRVKEEKTSDRPHDHRQIKEVIKEIQLRGPTLHDYLEYIDYLRHNSPIRFDRVMQELQKEDPATWMKLQKYPQFRPLKESVVGLKAGSNILGAAAWLANGKFVGSTEKWMGSTLKDLMKRDRFGPYADVLGSKATTLPTTTPTYSNSRLGQYLKVEEAKAATAASNSAKDLASAEAGLRAAKGTAITRMFGPLLDLGIGLLDPQVAAGAANALVELKLTKAYERGDLTLEQYIEAHNLMAQGKFKEMQDYLLAISKAK
jgi:hypothetical protein